MIPRKPDMGKGVLTVPNLLSAFRLCLIPVCVWLYCVKQEYLMTTLVLVISGLTDVVDGFIARRFGMVSDVGKVLDPVADKLTQAAMLLCLLTRYRGMLIPFLLMAAKEIFAGISGWLVIRKTGNVFCAKWHGKLATVLLYIMLVLHLLWVDLPEAVSNLMIFVCSAAIAMSFVLYGVHNMRLIAAHSAPKRA